MSVSVRVEDGAHEVFLYSHWGAQEILETLRTALFAAQADKRLDDAPYLTRIIFCHLMMPEELYETNDYGISGYRTGDREVIINVNNQTIESDDYDLPLQSIRDFIFNSHTEEDEHGDEEELAF